jgi:hypothetical protein
MPNPSAWVHILPTVGGIDHVDRGVVLGHDFGAGTH